MSNKQTEHVLQIRVKAPSLLDKQTVARLMSQIIDVGVEDAKAMSVDPDISNPVADLAAQLTIEIDGPDDTLGTKPFTVIGFYEDSGQIFSHHVQAKDGLAAFSTVAQSYPSAEFVAALPGHLKENANELFFPGDSLVSAETVIAQPEVFGLGASDLSHSENDSLARP